MVIIKDYRGMTHIVRTSIMRYATQTPVNSNKNGLYYVDFHFTDNSRHSITVDSKETATKILVEIAEKSIDNPIKL